MKTITITGASGFIGTRLVIALLHAGGYRIRVLSRSLQAEKLRAIFSAEVEIVQGDLRVPASLDGFLEPGCTVINLVYLWNEGEAGNLAVIGNLIELCKSVGVARLLHCSTAAVVGRVPDDIVTESTECRPISAYGITKLKIEKMVVGCAAGSFDAAIIRPTAVFGPDGEPLKKLIKDLVNGNRLANYLKSSLFGTRRMNLVHVTNVVAAIVFLIQRSEPLRGETFIISDDDSPRNNFRDIELFLMRSLKCPDHVLPRIPLPLSVLGMLLRHLGRNNINPRCNYVQTKLRGLGFISPVVFEDGLSEYAAWHLKTLAGRHGGAE